MAKRESRVAALRKESFEIKSPLPDAYEDVIEGLSDEELKVLINLKRRLDEAETKTPADAGPWRTYFVPF